MLMHISAMSPALFLDNHKHTHFLSLIIHILMDKHFGVDFDNNI